MKTSPTLSPTTVPEAEPIVLEVIKQVASVKNWAKRRVGREIVITGSFEIGKRQ